jgi:hypothetical protein
LNLALEQLIKDEEESYRFFNQFRELRGSSKDGKFLTDQSRQAKV